MNIDFEGISILAVLADRDFDGRKRKNHFVVFQSSRSLRTATSPSPSGSSAKLFQSSRSLRTATRRPDATPPSGHFNPRGPCGPRRRKKPQRTPPRRHFNPRGPCGPRQAMGKPVRTRQAIFQSSRSLRTATRFAKLPEQKKTEFQSSRSLRTATGLPGASLRGGEAISILAVLADRDDSSQIRRP